MLLRAQSGHSLCSDQTTRSFSLCIENWHQLIVFHTQPLDPYIATRMVFIANKSAAVFLFKSARGADMSPLLPSCCTKKRRVTFKS